jgi:NTE family protein
VGELNLEHRHDSLDNLWFPTSGFLSRTGYRVSRDFLGSSADYEQAFTRFTSAHALGKNSLRFNFEGGYSFDDDTPVERWWELGGFGRISGLVPNQLAGPNYGLVSMAYYRRLNEVELAPVYAGISLEAGNVWRDQSSISLDNLIYAGSLFLGVDTPIGPVYLAWGSSDTHESTFYFYLGNPLSTRNF